MRSRHASTAAVGFVVLALPAFAGPMTARDRQQLVAHLEMTISGS